MADSPTPAPQVVSPITVPGLRTSPAISNLAAALAKSQGAMRSVSKDLSATVQMKSGGQYTYRYADLGSVIEAIRGPLAENGLAFLQPVSIEGQKVTVTTVLTHSSGEWVSCSLSLLAAEATAQSLGSAITYGRRYLLCSLIGVASIEDDDGVAAGVGPQQRGNQRPHQQSRGDQRGAQRGNPQTQAGPQSTTPAPQGEAPKPHPNLQKLGDVLRGAYRCTNAADYTLLIQYATDDRSKSWQWLRDNPGEVDAFLSQLSQYATASNLKPEELLDQVKACETNGAIGGSHAQQN